MMWAFAVPPRSARNDDSTFGSIPPSITDSSIRRSASLGLSVVMSPPWSPRMPCTSVRWMSFSAPSAAATSPATRSALMLYVSPEAPTPTGAMTGMNPWSSRSRIASGLTCSTSPTSPMSTSSPEGSRCSRRRARMSEPSLPESPTALPPWKLIRPTISLLILPTRTISTISTVSSSVTRMPPTNFGSLPSRFMSAPIWGPPPWTITGSMPTKRSRITSSANDRLRSPCSMAEPPYLMTTVLPRNSRMYGSASMRISARRLSMLMGLQDVPREVLVADDIGQPLPHVGGVDGDLLAGHRGRVERHVFQQLLHDRVEPPGPDILRRRVDLHADLRHRLHRVGREPERDLLRPQQLDVLPDQRVLRFRQNADEILARQRVELHANGEPALQLRDEIGGLGDVEGAGGDEQDVVGADDPVLGVDRGALDDRQKVALHALAGDLGTVATFAPGDLVQLVQEDDARVFDGRMAWGV